MQINPRRIERTQDRRGAPSLQLGMERQEQKPVSLHVTLLTRARGSSEGGCYKTAALKAITPSTTDRAFNGIQVSVSF
jgi:hypothetical protein